MFPSIEPDTETAVTVPKVVAGVLVNIARNVKRNAVIEHIAEQVLVGVARHNHKPVVVRLPTVQHNDIPIPVLSIYIVVCAAHGALGADNLFDERFEFRTIAGNDESVRDILHNVAVFVLEIAHLIRENAERVLKDRKSVV